MSAQMMGSGSGVYVPTAGVEALTALVGGLSVSKPSKYWHPKL